MVYYLGTIMLMCTVGLNQHTHWITFTMFVDKMERLNSALCSNYGLGNSMLNLIGTEVYV